MILRNCRIISVFGRESDSIILDLRNARIDFALKMAVIKLKLLKKHFQFYIVAYSPNVSNHYQARLRTRSHYF